MLAVDASNLLGAAGVPCVLLSTVTHRSGYLPILCEEAEFKVFHCFGDGAYCAVCAIIAYVLVHITFLERSKIAATLWLRP
jgi:hypothetical protein